jgi:RHS repeat-associated protein
VVALYIGRSSLDTISAEPGFEEDFDLGKGATDSINGMYYIHTDHLGSYCAITDIGKNVVQRNFFDVWGNFFYFTMDSAIIDTNIYNPDIFIPRGLSGNVYKNFTLINRGFTGHEHYPNLKIINMNGRIYDPVIARFFSPDKYVVNSSFTQDYNRYSYARNNPLKYVDPDGEWIHLVIGAIIGGVMNWAMNGAEFSWKGLGYFGIGAAAGALGAGIGAGAGVVAVGGSFGAGFVGSASAAGFGAGFASGLAGGFTSGFISGAGNTWMQGGTFGQGIFGGLKSGFISGSIGGITGGIMGGITAKMNSANFWDGSFSRDFAVPGTSDLTYQQALENAKTHNKLFADAADIHLADKMNSEFGYKAGMLDNGTLTTKPPSDYGLTQSQYYMKPDGTLVGGNFRGTLGIPSTYQMHISPNVTFGNIVDFRAIAGHELIHAFHVGAFGRGYNASWSEASANRYSYNVFMNAGIHKPNLYNRLGYFPRSYLTPLHLFW